jgi:hypothetical protein
MVLPTTFTDYYGASAPVDYEWPLVADWCRESPAVPWRICGPDDNTMTTGNSDTVVSTVAPTVTPSTLAHTTSIPAVVNDEETTVPTLNETSNASGWRVGMGAWTMLQLTLSAIIVVV